MHIFNVVLTLFFPKCLLRLKEDGPRKGRWREGYTDSNYPLKPLEHHNTYVLRGSKRPPICSTIILRDVSPSDRRWKCFQSEEIFPRWENSAERTPNVSFTLQTPVLGTARNLTVKIIFCLIGESIQTESSLVFELNGKFQMQLDYVKFNKKTISIPVCEFVCVPTNYINNKVCILSFEIRDTTLLV